MELSEQSKAIRRQILEEAYKHKHGHIASCFSCVEILLAIKEIMKPEDFFILSKGHAILAEKSVFGKEVSCFKTGSLGHGIGVGAGIALGNPDSNVYVVVGDGELQEGSCWEALQFIEEKLINNLFIIIDHNMCQASRSLKETFVYEVLHNDWYTEVDGHNIKELKKWLVERLTGPSIIIAKTIKGMSVSFIEADPVRFHTEIPSESDFASAIKELS